MNHLTYITANTSTLGSVDFSQIQETGKDSVRKSIDESEFVAKWEGETPETITNIPESDKSAEMDHETVLILMGTSEWMNPNPTE